MIELSNLGQLARVGEQEGWFTRASTLSIPGDRRRSGRIATVLLLFVLKKWRVNQNVYPSKVQRYVSVQPVGPPPLYYLTAAPYPCLFSQIRQAFEYIHFKSRCRVKVYWNYFWLSFIDGGLFLGMNPTLFSFADLHSICTSARSSISLVHSINDSAAS